MLLSWAVSATLLALSGWLYHPEDPSISLAQILSTIGCSVYKSVLTALLLVKQVNQGRPSLNAIKPVVVLLLALLGLVTPQWHLHVSSYESLIELERLISRKFQLLRLMISTLVDLVLQARKIMKEKEERKKAGRQAPTPAPTRSQVGDSVVELVPMGIFSSKESSVPSQATASSVRYEI